MTDEQRERDIASLVQMAREILEYVADPGERPDPYIRQSVSLYPMLPKSLAQDAREKADRLESQSRAVRNLKRELEKWLES